MTPSATDVIDKSTATRPDLLRVPWRSVMSSGAMAAILLLGMALRLYHIDFQSLWDDEGYSVALLGRDFWSIAAETPLGNMPFYYFLLAAWTAFAGASDFAIRYLSLWFGVLLIPLTYRLSRDMFGYPACLPAALLAAILPSLLYQSQSARQYTLLPALFAINMLLAVRIANNPGSIRLWLALSATAASISYTHYYGLAVLAAAIVALAPVMKRDRRVLLGLAATSLATLSVFLSYVISQFQRILHYSDAYAVRGEINLSKRLVELATDVWIGIIAQVSYGINAGPQYRWTLVPLAGLLLGCVFLFRRADKLHATIVMAYLLIPTVGGILVALLQTFNPRYLLLLSPLCVALISGVASSQHLRFRLMGLALVGATVGLSVPAVITYYQNPIQEDIRSLAQRVADQARPGDGLVVNSDWRWLALAHYFRDTPAPPTSLIPLEATPDEAIVRTKLDRVMAERERIWVAFFGATPQSTTHAIGPILSEKYARVVDEWYGTTRLGLFVRGPIGEGQATAGPSPSATFGSELRAELRGLSWPEKGEPLDSVVAAIEWKALRPLDRNLGASLRLIDKDGKVWAQADGEPSNGTLHTKGKSTGERWHEHRGLLVPAGTPPGDYDLILAAYDQGDGQPLTVDVTSGTARARALVAGAIRVESARLAPSASLLPLSMSQPIDYNGRVALIGGKWPSRIKAGETMGLQTYWRGVKVTDSDYQVVIQLKPSGGQAITSLRALLGGSGYPASRWRPGEVVRQLYDIPVSPLATGGLHQLEVMVEDGVSGKQVTPDTGRAVLGLVTVDPRPKVPAPPIQGTVDTRLGPDIRLLGYALEGDGGELPLARAIANPGKPLKVYLYWRWEPANGTIIDRSYTAFVHLLNENGVLAAQHDGIPVGGEVPTTSWPPGEVIVDAHSLSLSAAMKPGRYSLIAGLYDSKTIERLKARDGRDHAGLGPLTVEVGQ